MQKEWLLPYGFKKVGWVLFFLALAVGVWAATVDFDYESVAALRDLELCNPLINNYIVIGLWLGVIFVGCSREKVEDEMIGRIRLNALLTAFYLQTAFIIVATLCCNNLAYLYVMLYNLVTYPIIFMLVFRAMLWHARKGVRNEE